MYVNTSSECKYSLTLAANGPHKSSESGDSHEGTPRGHASGLKRPTTPTASFSMAIARPPDIEDIGREDVNGGAASVQDASLPVKSQKPFTASKRWATLMTTR